jgi:hypothetical protein
VRALDRNLSVLSDAEQLALYGQPDFDDFQRAEYCALNEAERSLVQRRKGLAEQIFRMVQIVYFKAKHAFFSAKLNEIPQEDIDFLLQRYFPGRLWQPHPIDEDEVYRQRNHIVALFGYRLWSDKFSSSVKERAAQSALREVAPTFILTELLAWLQQEKTVRPGYTTLQTLISEALSAERARLGNLLEAALDDTAISALQRLLVRENALSELAVIKQDPKDFGYRMMVKERAKRATLEPLYGIAKALLRRSRSPSRTAITTRASSTFTPSMTCAASSPDKHTCICCATCGSGTARSTTRCSMLWDFMSGNSNSAPS